MPERNATVAVIGAGDFIGAAIARRFAAAGFTVFAGRRNGDKLAPLVADIEGAGGRVVARSLDARKEEEIVAFLADAERHAPLEVCIFNIGANVNFPLLETTERVFRKVWEMGCYSGFLATREAARHMLPRGRGCIFLTGATASLARRRRLLGVRQCQVRSARRSTKRRSRARSEEHSRRALDYRCRRRYRLRAGADQGCGRRGSAREHQAGSAHAAGIGRRSLLGPVSAAARCVDLRARDPAVRGEVVMRVEFHFDFGSPNAYLSHVIIPRIEQRTGAKFEYVPILLGGVFKLTNNRSPIESYAGIRNKLPYEHLETQRFIKKHGIENYQFNPFFPVNTLALMRGAVAAQRLGVFERYVDEMFRHMWAQPKDMDDPAVIGAALQESGFDAAKLMALAQDQSVKDELAANTSRSVERGTFGAPTFFVGDEIYFGKDRLRDVEEAIVAGRK